MALSGGRVTIVGGGYAGLQAVLRLAHVLDNRWSIRLIDAGSAHQLITRLPEVAGGRIEPRLARVPFERLLPPRVEFVNETVDLLDPAARTVRTSHALYSADWLIIATGTTPFTSATPGGETAFTLRSVDQAIKLHHGIDALLHRQQTVKVVLIGGGYTATELAGELIDWNDALVESRSDRRLGVTVVNDERRLLPGGNARLGAVAQRVLTSKGVVIRHGSPVVSVALNGVTHADGTETTADVVVWAARSHVDLRVTNGKWPAGPDGRAQVDEYLRSAFERVYVIGDAALAYDFSRGVPAGASAQLAVEEGQIAADNVGAEILGRRLRAFQPKLAGEALSLGSRDGASEVAGLVLTGRAALAVKRVALTRYLTRIGGPRLAGAYV